MATEAKIGFLNAFNGLILRPRGLNYKFQFTGPTGADAVEASLKLARRVTGRQSDISFTNGFHGVTLGALGVTASSYFRSPSGLPRVATAVLPYEGYLGPDVDTAEYLGLVLADTGSGIEPPAAVIVETIQAEGGVNAASYEWLRALQGVCREHGVLLIVDDIQVGCGRTGPFFSFEEAEIVPDIVILSKSLSGFGLPLSVVLLRPEIDRWRRGEHTGTFRGNNLALVPARAALENYWQDEVFVNATMQKGANMGRGLRLIARQHGAASLNVRGRGMVYGLDCQTGALANSISQRAFEKGLIVETCGARGHVIKCLPPLTIEGQELERGLEILRDSVDEVLADASSAVPLQRLI